MENLTRIGTYLIHVGKEKSYINIFKYEEEEERGIQQWKNPMENTENPTKIRLQLIFNGKRAHRRI
jgi:hypothetical protein